MVIFIVKHDCLLNSAFQKSKLVSLDGKKNLGIFEPGTLEGRPSKMAGKGDGVTDESGS